MTTFHHGVLVVVAALLGGCAARVEVLPVRRSAPALVRHAVEAPPPKAWWDEPATRPAVQRNRLVARLRDDPAFALRELESKISPENHPADAAALATLTFLHGQKLERTQPPEALGQYLNAAALAYRHLGTTALSPATNQALLDLRSAYNRATEGVVRLLQELPGGLQSNQIVAAGGGLVRIETVLGDGAASCGPDGRWLPAERWAQRGLSHRFRNDGFGAPMIAMRTNHKSSPLEQHRPDEGIFDHATAVLEFPSSRGGAAESPAARLVFHNPVLTPEVAVNGSRWPLAADYTIPWAMLLSQTKPLLKSRWSALRQPAATPRPRRLYLVGPYSPDRMPVIMVHGLGSTPLAWQELTNELLGDPEIRGRYQFWHYLYPTGFPFLTSAADFRDELEDVRRLLDPEGNDLASQHMIVIGHSMGGLLTRTLVTDSGDALWNSVFALPADEITADEAELRQLRRWFFFQPKPYVKRAIFIAVPHRGTKLAGGFLGRLASRQVHLPDELHHLVSRLQESNPGLLRPEAAPMFARGFPDSIRTLSPQSSRLLALAELPVAAATPFHSIMGDRGIGGGPKSSDGAVAYWSSHLPGASSEIIVPTGHRAYEHPLAIAEVKRILKLHLAEQSRDGRTDAGRSQ